MFYYVKKIKFISPLNGGNMIIVFIDIVEIAMIKLKLLKKINLHGLVNVAEHLIIKLVKE